MGLHYPDVGEVGLRVDRVRDAIRHQRLEHRQFSPPLVVNDRDKVTRPLRLSLTLFFGMFFSFQVNETGLLQRCPRKAVITRSILTTRMLVAGSGGA